MDIRIHYMYVGIVYGSPTCAAPCHDHMRGSAPPRRCAEMTCGRDAKDKGGGNRQDGCGKKFDWSTAAAYSKVGGSVLSFQECRRGIS